MRKTALADKSVVISRLNDLDLVRLDRALIEARELQSSILRRRGGKQLSPSWPIIRAARESINSDS